LPPGLYSVTRWKPFLRAAATPEGLAAFPPELRPLILKLRRDYEVLYRGPILRDLATPSMFGTAALAAP
jgi:hypothetical protein